MKWLRDRSGRFEQRPFYDQHELDAQCEEIVEGLPEEQERRHGLPDHHRRPDRDDRAGRRRARPVRQPRR